jgi:hypothetical protein
MHLAPLPSPSHRRAAERDRDLPATTGRTRSGRRRKTPWLERCSHRARLMESSLPPCLGLAPRGALIGLAIVLPRCGGFVVGVWIRARRRASPQNVRSPRRRGAKLTCNTPPARTSTGSGVLEPVMTQHYRGLVAGARDLRCAAIRSS